MTKQSKEICLKILNLALGITSVIAIVMIVVNKGKSVDLYMNIGTCLWLVYTAILVAHFREMKELPGEFLAMIVAVVTTLVVAGLFNQSFFKYTFWANIILFLVLIWYCTMYLLGKLDLDTKPQEIKGGVS